MVPETEEPHVDFLRCVFFLDPIQVGIAFEIIKHVCN